MFGIGKRPSDTGTNASIENHDVAKLFFDAFSKRLGSFETTLNDLSSEVGRLKASGDQSKLSDLVLLERLQRTGKIQLATDNESGFNPDRSFSRAARLIELDNDSNRASGFDSSSERRTKI